MAIKYTFFVQTDMSDPVNWNAAAWSIALSGNDILIGSSYNDYLIGYAGDDLLDGGLGADTMVGGFGNDTYVVDNVGDVVIEQLRGNTDLVNSSISYSLTANVENLTLTGSGAINGTGNDLANVITGNAGNNVLDGGLGADTLVGGLGNDTYVVDNVGDVVTELAAQGHDLVRTSVNYTLSANVDDITLTGNLAINATGNDLANIITGNDANNVLIGGAGDDLLIGLYGNDQLTGGLGADSFMLTSAPSNITPDVDTITDFNNLQGDKIYLLQSSFANIVVNLDRSLNMNDLLVSNNHSDTASQHFLFDTSTHGLYYNSDGSGYAAAMLVASMSAISTSAQLKGADFYII